MTRRPNDPTPEPSGGHAADRLREFLQGRLPPGDESILPDADATPSDTGSGASDADATARCDDEPASGGAAPLDDTAPEHG